MIAVVCEPRGRRRGSGLEREAMNRPLESCRIEIAALVVLLRGVDGVAAGRFLWAETTTLLAPKCVRDHPLTGFGPGSSLARKLESKEEISRTCLLTTTPLVHRSVEL